MVKTSLWVALLLISLTVTTPGYEAQPEVKCRAPSDVIFLLDGSESLSEPDFEKMKQFVESLLDRFHVEPAYTRVGALVFGTLVRDTIILGRYATRADLYGRIDKLSQPQSGTGTARGLQRMRRMFKTEGRPGVTRVGIVITDGRSLSPPRTEFEAKGAKKENISMVAIGFGSDVFTQELETIASSRDTVFESDNFAKLVTAVETALRDVICHASRTTLETTTKQTTIQPFQPDGNKVEPFKEVCPNCILDKNMGYRNHPKDCTKFIRIFPDSSGNRTEAVVNCPFGTFWDTTSMSCKNSHEVVCEHDPCRGLEAGTVAMPTTCSGFWKCDEGRSFAQCCPNFRQRFVPSFGCRDDMNCLDSCKSPKPQVVGLSLAPGCALQAVAGDETRYIEFVEGYGNVKRQCAPGTGFHLASCSCGRLIKTMPSLPVARIQVCRPEVYFPFDGSIRDISGNGITIGIEKVDVTDRLAVFGGQGHINIWRFSNIDFESKLVITFNFHPSGLGEPVQALLTNCIYSDEQESSIAILVIPTARMVLVKTATYDSATTVAAPYRPGVINTLTYVYDGRRLTLAVNGVSQSKPLSGNILRRQTGIIIGAGSRLGYFNGEIDESLRHRFLTTKVIPVVTSQVSDDECHTSCYVTDSRRGGVIPVFTSKILDDEGHISRYVKDS
ncbi:hypothetical protein ScPMuIL_003132 [Solemya velum]